tara:strand:+ start:13014 stop:14309 length:1296 start_codon:yes stop_codon:yes gene_type:complete
MNILIIGSGGREHALAWKSAQSPLVKMVYVAPGNAGTAIEEKVKNINISATDIEKLKKFAQDNKVDLTIVGPEAPLVLGLVDIFKAANLACFGPTKKAAQLEGSKSFTKDFLMRHGIPTAKYQVFTDLQPALFYLNQINYPIVIKDDGLAAGKGVVIAHTKKDAETAITDMLEKNIFQTSSQKIVIEEYLEGEEVSFIVMVDGQNILPMATSQDHKRAYDNDLGPNTGGMGAYSPAPIVSSEIQEKILDEVIRPTVDGMLKENNPYVGFLYAGLMISKNNDINVIEYNCRFGDPETQPILMRMKSDLVEHCIAALNHKLDKEKAMWSDNFSLGVVLATKNYPGEYEKDLPISGLEECKAEGSKIFHAGTKTQNNVTVTDGGRVLCVTALGESASAAQGLALSCAKKISWKNSFYRKDIGYRAIDKENNNSR